MSKIFKLFFYLPPRFNPNQTDAQLFAAYSTLLQQLNSTSAPTIKLQLANGAALQNNYPLLPAYLNVVNNDFNAKVFSVDFKAKAAEATEEINRWAGEKTNGKIPKLFDEPLDRDTRLVLLNALYFKGGWAFPFHNSSTEEREFFLPQSGQKVNVSMMAKYDEKIRHASFEDGDLVELPYEGNTLSMLLFLPNQARTPQNQSSISGAFLKALKAQSEAGSLLSAYGKLRTTDVNLMLPRFKVESSFKLKPILQVLGIRTAFDEQKVDFSGMTGQRNLVLSEVVHKTFVKVNEEGSEAAAVTAGVMVKLLSARFTDPKTVNFNRPFLFAIRDNAKQLTLFAGIINKPEY